VLYCPPLISFVMRNLQGEESESNGSEEWSAESGTGTSIGGWLGDSRGLAGLVGLASVSGG